MTETGEEESEWIKSGDDHFFHAANYLSIAAELVDEDFGGWAPIPTIREVIVGSNSPHQIDQANLKK